MDNELVMYLLVNQDIGMGKGKVAAQCCHAATIYTYRTLTNTHTNIICQQQTEDFHKWYSYIQKKIVLKASQELLEKLEVNGYISIRDKGYTQIPENSLTVVTLGITTRESVSEIVKDLKLL